eukprot:m.151478 g.151478  ORF g.151478 m.151478 type:complete len:366 (+) comp30761_c0_seq1:263-1360(+)
MLFTDGGDTSTMDGGDDFAVVPRILAPSRIGPFADVNPELNGKFSGVHCKLKERVLIDVIGKISSDNRETLVRSVNTANWLKGHPNVQRILWISQSIPLQTLFIVSEYVGDNLQSIVRRLGPFPEVEARPVANQVVMAVRFFHGNNILHQSLTAENIYLDQTTGVVKISGFGKANQIGNSYRRYALENTLKYCTPELVIGMDITKLEKTKTDIWGIGSVIYTMVVGALPFERSSSSLTRLAILNEDPHLPVSLSEPCQRLLNMTLQKEPANRPSCEQIHLCIWLQGAETMATHHTNVQPAGVDDVLRSMGMSESCILTSTDESVYSIEAAERYLATRALQRRQHPCFVEEEDDPKSQFVHEVPTW